MLSALKIEMGRNTKKAAENRPFKFRDFKAIIKSKMEISKTKLQTIVQKKGIENSNSACKMYANQGSIAFRKPLTMSYELFKQISNNVWCSFYLLEK